MNAKLSTFRLPLRVAVPLLVASAVTLISPMTAYSQLSYYAGPPSYYAGPPMAREHYAGPHMVRQQPLRSYHRRLPVQGVRSSSRLTYFRGTDGRIYGMRTPPAVALQTVRPQQLAPSSFYQSQRQPATSLAPRSSDYANQIVIEDAYPQTPMQQNIGIPSATYSSPVTGNAAAGSGNVDTSARSQAEDTLRRFEQLQGVGQASPSGQEEPVATVASAEEPPSPAAEPDSAASAEGGSLPPAKSY